MKVLRTINSLRMSFWIVPDRALCVTPERSAATTYMASTGSTAPFMVIETETLSSGMPASGQAIGPRARLSPQHNGSDGLAHESPFSQECRKAAAAV